MLKGEKSGPATGFNDGKVDLSCVQVEEGKSSGGAGSSFLLNCTMEGGTIVKLYRREGL